MIAAIESDPERARRYDTSGPGYTAYPSIACLREDFDEQDYIDGAIDADDRRPLSLNFHLPLARPARLCMAGRAQAVAKPARTNRVLQRVVREMVMQAELFGDRPAVDELRWDGGFSDLDMDQARWLFRWIRHAYPLRDDDRGDYAVVLDPWGIDPGTPGALRQLGFNHVCLRVRDLHRAMHRESGSGRPEATVGTMVSKCRDAGFRTVGIDLMHGLPAQTEHGFARTVDRLLAMTPDRFTLHEHPGGFGRLSVKTRDRPGPQVPVDPREAVVRRARQRLTGAGYVFLGMDQFVRPGDSLAHAQQSGALRRNLHGYTVHGDCDIVPHGPGATGVFGNCCVHNLREHVRYCAAVDQGRMPVGRGLFLSADDRVRRELIMRLLCDFELDTRALGRGHGLDFGSYFAAECRQLEPLVADGIVRWRGESLCLTASGRPLADRVAMIFDRYRAHGDPGKPLDEV